MQEIKDLEDSDYSEYDMKDVGLTAGRAKKITWRKAVGDERTRGIYKRLSTEMSQTTGMLKRKIDLYGNTQKYVIRNQKRGKIDKRMLHRIPAGRADLFKLDIIQQDKPLDICLLVDESGSMGSYKMEMARKSAIAIKEALADNPKLNLWVFGHTADGESGWHEEVWSTNMTEYWGPTMKDRPKAMGAMKARYENRDGTAIYAAATKVKKESEQPLSNKLMIILSDGQPAAYGYSGADGMNHVKKVVSHLEGQGWNIIQIGISGANKYHQERMFKNHMFVNDMDELAPKLGKIIRRVIQV
jgi:nitric oxide reductase activation protein